MQQIVIYTPKVTNRILYTFDFVFKQYFGWNFSIVESTEQLAISDANAVIINYSDTQIRNSFQVPQSNLLLEENICKQNIFISSYNDLPIFFYTENAIDLPFDVFSAVFYLISRYEEYLPHEQDEHGRYVSSNSILSKSIFSFRPIVEEWLLLLKIKLQNRHPFLLFKEHRFIKQYTFDIDNAFRYLERNWLINPPNLFKKEARQVLLRHKKDTYNNFDLITEFVEQHPSCTFFFLLNDNGKKNSTVSPYSNKLKKIIKELNIIASVGLHPSYYWNELSITKEKRLLEEITQQPVTKTRQHFLKINFPDYFELLANAGLTNDYSLAYPNEIGCRAGTTQSFYFFNLNKNKCSSLLLHPFVVMDATYQYYKPNDRQILQQEVETMLSQIKKINGTFVCLFHNDLLSPNLPFWNILNYIANY